jgi:hypothetical protein
MTEKNDDSSVIVETESEETKNFKDVIPEKVKHPSTWITAGLVVFYLFLLGILGFSFMGYRRSTILIYCLYKRTKFALINFFN